MATFKEIYLKRRSSKKYIQDDNGKYFKYGSIYNLVTEYPTASTGATRYKENTTPDKYIVGTALAFTSSLFELMFNFKIVYGWFRGLITDGYALILLSPFIYLYWALITILYLPILIFFGGLVIVAWYWTLLEIPASFLNKENLRDTCLRILGSIEEPGWALILMASIIPLIPIFVYCL